MAIHDRRSRFLKKLKSDLDGAKLTRREFVRYATLLGLSSMAAGQMAGLLLPRRASAVIARPLEAIRVATSIPKIVHPAQISCVESANILRHTAEYLTVIDENNITHPYLLKNWCVSEDLKTWTLNLRRQIKFNNGHLLTADDVVFSLHQWLDKNRGSSLLRIMGSYLDPGGIEKTDTFQLKLHLNKAEIRVPEHLFHYPAIILNHKTFEGDFTRAPHGTGPYKLEAYQEGERALLKHRSGYWQRNTGGNSPAKIDALEFLDMRAENPARICARKAAGIDFIDLAAKEGTAAFKALSNNQGIQLKPITPQARVLRMRVDLRPWNDSRVRMALKLCQGREKMHNLATFNHGLPGHDLRVCPEPPKLIKKMMPGYDPQSARKLLMESGYPHGLKVTLTVGSEWKQLIRYAEILKQDARPAGFNIKVEPVPGRRFWEKWTEVGLSLAPWGHRPQVTAMADQVSNSPAGGPSLPWMGVLMSVRQRI